MFKLFNWTFCGLYHELDTPDKEVMLWCRKFCRVHEIGQVVKDEHGNWFVHHYSEKQALESFQAKRSSLYVNNENK